MANYELKNLIYNTETIDDNKLKDIEPKINFLFVVHNEIEMGEMQQAITPLSHFSVILDFIDPECMQHFLIGKFFKYDIVLAKTSDMGSRNVNSVENVINRAIQIFRPRYIVMPGIAAGLDDGMSIGDVVIADKIIGYESEKIAPYEVIGRYPEFRSPRLFNLFCSANVHTFNLFLKTVIQKNISEEASMLPTAKSDCKTNCPKEVEKGFSWQDSVNSYNYPRVHTGNYISGEILLNNAEYRHYLKSKFKEAVALDMEGVGVASASTFNRVYDWLVIKGISDFGDGNKGVNKTERQIYAMKNVILTLKKIFDDEHSFPDSSLKQLFGYGRKNVLISASQCDRGNYTEITEFFMERLAKQLIVSGFNVINGYGIDVGPSILYGIYDGCDQLRLPLREYANRYQCFAFPRRTTKDFENDRKSDDKKLEWYKAKNRRIMCENAQIAIFAFGNKRGPSGADGMFEELNLVAEHHALVLPIGCTKGTALEICKAVCSQNGIEDYLMPYFRDRKKYCVIAGDPEEDVRKYCRKLMQISRISLNENNIDVVIGQVIELLNFYG